VRNAHAVDEVRKAERALMARLPDGALMQRAAAGLASACARLEVG
jgi:NAD(P)H-hydrate repair Nnr-like enzyme with NAD(P)H-hydrate epimerase domain